MGLMMLVALAMLAFGFEIVKIPVALGPVPEPFASAFTLLCLGIGMVLLFCTLISLRKPR